MRKSIPFVDCGMGLNRVIGGLNGTARITGVDRAAFEKTAAGTATVDVKTKEDEYRAGLYHFCELERFYCCQ